jgi:hypothetical protein
VEQGATAARARRGCRPSPAWRFARGILERARRARAIGVEVLGSVVARGASGHRIFRLVHRGNAPGASTRNRSRRAPRQRGAGAASVAARGWRGPRHGARSDRERQPARNAAEPHRGGAESERTHPRAARASGSAPSTVRSGRWRAKRACAAASCAGAPKWASRSPPRDARSPGRRRALRRRGVRGGERGRSRVRACGWVLARVRVGARAGGGLSERRRQAPGGVGSRRPPGLFHVEQPHRARTQPGRSTWNSVSEP